MVDLKKVIKRYGITQSDLANRWGVYQSAVSQMLSGGKISIDKLYDIADACGCTLSELVAEELCEHAASLTCPKCGAKLKVGVSVDD